MLTVIIIYGLPLLLLVLIYIFWNKKTSKVARTKLETSERSGLTEPVSLHPIIDPFQCLGCGTCVSACPEGKILGLINNKAQLVSPTSCIGHGVCKEACPTDAITLVFGSTTRGVDIPLLTPDFETNVPGMYIAGELGGMGLIKNAIRQGNLAIDAMGKQLKKAPADVLDVAIVGAGPTGLSAALAAIDKKMSYVLLEQDSIGGTLAHYPRGKIVMTQPAELPIVGTFQFREASKESLIDFWMGAIQKADVKVTTGARVDNVTRQGDHFVIESTTGTYKAQKVLLALGRRGTPRKLGVPGESLSKVVYKLVDPAQYKGMHVVVVGGGDSAIEAAMSIADEPGTTVTLSYRSEAFSRAKPKNRERVEEAGKKGQLNVMLSSNVKKIEEKSIDIQTQEDLAALPNDAVIVCAGGILPTPFLKKVGIEVETKFGTE